MYVCNEGNVEVLSSSVEWCVLQQNKKMEQFDCIESQDKLFLNFNLLIWNCHWRNVVTKWQLKQNF